MGTVWLRRRRVVRKEEGEGANAGMVGGEISASSVEAGSVNTSNHPKNLIQEIIDIHPTLKVRMTEEDSRSWLAEAAGNYTANMK